MEEQKNKLGDELNVKVKELRKNKDSEADVAKKYETLQKKYDQECNNLKGAHDKQAELNAERLGELEATLARISLLSYLSLTQKRFKRK